MPHTSTDRHRRSSQRALLRGVTVVFVIGTSVLATGCGSPAESTPALSQTAKAQTRVACTRLADALADGPDPSADPVGYALSQVSPLREIKTSDRALQRDINALASAYEAVYRTNGKKGSEAQVDKAGKELDTICPGAY